MFNLTKGRCCNPTERCQCPGGLCAINIADAVDLESLLCHNCGHPMGGHEDAQGIVDAPPPPYYEEGGSMMPRQPAQVHRPPLRGGGQQEDETQPRQIVYTYRPYTAEPLPRLLGGASSGRSAAQNLMVFFGVIFVCCIPIIIYRIVVSSD